jgi:hypothetical protein
MEMTMATPTIEVSYTAMVANFRFLDLPKAQAAYDQITEAVKAFKRFGNDRNETIEIETQDGKAMLKLEHIETVTFGDGSSFEAELRKRLETEKLARSMREEFGLPVLSR